MCFLFSRILCVLIAKHKSSGNNNFSFFIHFLADGEAWSAIRRVGLSVKHILVRRPGHTNFELSKKKLLFWNFVPKVVLTKVTFDCQVTNYQVTNLQTLQSANLSFIQD